MLLLRIFLAVAILAGVGVIVVSQVVLKPQIEEIAKTRDDNKTGWDKELSRANGLAKKLAATEKVLQATKASLEEALGKVTELTGKFESEQKRANGLQQTLDKAKSDLKTAQDDLAAYTGTGFKPEEIRGLAASVKEKIGQVEGLIEEGKLLASNLKKVTKAYDDLRGTKIEDPLVPSTVRGQVLVVDPKWDFLVLNVGEKQEVPANGILLVSRDGVLIAKVRIMSVQKDRSIANIMPGWKLKDVMEGDTVVPY